MTDPICQNRGFYEFPVDACRINDCEGGLNAPAAGPAGTPTPPNKITLDPVTIVGELGSRELIQQYDATQARAPSCRTEKDNAELTCLSAAGNLLAAAPAGPLLGSFVAFNSGLSCGRELRDLYDCEQRK